MPVPRLDWSSAVTVDHAAGRLSAATHDTPNTTPSPRGPRLDRCKSPIVVSSSVVDCLEGVVQSRVVDRDTIVDPAQEHASVEKER